MPTVKMNKWSHESKPDFPGDFFHLFIKDARHVVKKKKKLTRTTRRVSFPSRNLRQRLQYASSQPATPNKCTFFFSFFIFFFLFFFIKASLSHQQQFLLPPPRRSRSWKRGWGPCVASGCPSHTPSAATRRRPPTSPTRSAAGTDRPGGGERRNGRQRWGGVSEVGGEGRRREEGLEGAHTSSAGEAVILKNDPPFRCCCYFFPHRLRFRFLCWHWHYTCDKKNKE